MRSIRSLCIAVAAVMSAGVMTADAATVNPGQTLQIGFSMSGPANPAVDTLLFWESDNKPFVNAVARLYNGATLLGSVNFTTMVGSSFGFVKPSSLFTFGSLGTVSDWSSFINGTIDGILKITFDKSVDISIGLNILGFGVGSNSLGNYGIPAPVIASTAVLAETPLPAALPMFAGGCGALGLIGWRRKRAKWTAAARCVRRASAAPGASGRTHVALASLHPRRSLAARAGRRGRVQYQRPPNIGRF